MLSGAAAAKEASAAKTTAKAVLVYMFETETDILESGSRAVGDSSKTGDSNARPGHVEIMYLCIRKKSSVHQCTF